jgi:hypothetical protein
MAKPAVLLAALACGTCLLSASAKIFVFKADKCNTNFNTAENFDTAAAPMSGAKAVPKSVEFGAKGVDVYVPEGEYEFGGLAFDDDMEFTFTDASATLYLNEAAAGPVATFVAGQTNDKAACSIGCHTNFYQFNGNVDAAVAADITKGATDDRMTDSTATPCNRDTVVVPKGYNVNLLAQGFHAFRSIVYAGGGDKAVKAKSLVELPAFMFYPTKDPKLYVGNSVLNYCEAAGMANDDRCICATECPAGPAAALAQANLIRDASKKHAQKMLERAASTDMEDTDVEFTYRGAFPLGTVNAGCAVNTKTMTDALNARFTEWYNDKVKVKSVQGVTVNVEDGSIVIEASLEAMGGVLDGQKTSFSEPVRIGAEETNSTVVGIDAKTRTDGSLAIVVYHSLVKAMSAVSTCGVGSVSAAAFLKTAGITKLKKEATVVVYAGANMAQMDVNRLVDARNKVGVVDRVYDGIMSMQGIITLDKDALFSNWKLVAPKRARARRAGLATKLVKVVLVYTGFVTAAGMDTSAVAGMIGALMATFEVKTHHKCFTLKGGFDDDCVEKAVAAVMAAQLKICTDADPKSVENCRSAAIAAAKKELLAIKGCGLQGTTMKGGKEVCADPAAEQKAAVAAVAAAESAGSAAVSDAVVMRKKSELALNATLGALSPARQLETNQAVAAAQRAALMVEDVEAALGEAVTKKAEFEAAVAAARAASKRARQSFRRRPGSPQTARPKPTPFTRPSRTWT